MEIKRCYPTLVGASVAENQLIEWGGEYVSNATDARENIMLFIRYGTGLADPNAFSKTISSVGLVSAIINATRSATGINIYHNGQFTNIYFYTDTNFEWMIGHKYIFSADFLGVNPTVVGGIKINNMMIIDLTQMFGSTIADYAYTLEQATAGSGIAWLRSYSLITDEYKPYNTGTIESVEATAKVVRDENNENAVTYPLGTDTLRGIFKLDANNKLYADGDRKKADGTITRYYGTRAYQEGDESLADAITDGTTTVYKLSTPTTETSTPFTSPQIVYPDGTEEFVTENGVPVGHETKYQL